MSELEQCRTAFVDLASQKWDTLAGLNTLKKIVPIPVVARSATGVQETKRLHVGKVNGGRPADQPHWLPRTGSTITEKQWRRLLLCYDTDWTQTRVSLRRIPSVQQEFITAISPHDDDEFQRELWESWSTSPDIKFRLWKATNHTLWTSSTGNGACGYYTIAHLINRGEELPSLNFQKYGRTVSRRSKSTP